MNSVRSCENDKARLLWDLQVATERAAEANKPDILLINHEWKEALIIDIAIPFDKNLVKTTGEKQKKYQA